MVEIKTEKNGMAFRAMHSLYDFEATGRLRWLGMSIGKKKILWGFKTEEDSDQAIKLFGDLNIKILEVSK